MPVAEADIDAFARYRDLVPDWAAACDALRRPLPTCLWTNTLRTTPDALAARLAEEGVRLTPLDWYPGAFRADGDVSLGTTVAYRAGLYNVQEEVALLPTSLLDVQPGHRVWDVAAAPGNKTAQIAVALGNTGTVVANDRSGGRMNVARTTFDRLGLANVCTTLHDAASYPKEAGLFDRVMADVPCSCEGTSRKAPLVLARSRPDQLIRLARTQTRILRRAVDLCAPGGRVVYATCTYAPEENEAVVDAVLRERDDLRLVPVETPGFVTSPGLDAWNGQSFGTDLRHALRIWPHQNDTGGFFVAVLEKAGGALPAPAPWTPPEERDAVIALLADRFGIPAAAWDPYRIFRDSVRFVSIAPRDFQPPPSPRPVTRGQPLVRTNLRFPKLRTGAAMHFGPLATRNVVPLDAEQARRFVARQVIDLTEAQAAHVTDKGYVLLRHDEAFLGLGFYLEADRAVGSLYPKAWALPPVD